MLEKLEKTIKATELKRKALFEKRKPIDEQLRKLSEKLDDLRERKAELQVAEMKAENFVPTPGNWFSPKELELVLLGETNSMTLYRHADWLMINRFNYAFARDGYCPETGQTVFRVSLVKGNKERTKLVKDAILFMLPHIKWRTKDSYDCDVDPFIRFDIFEHNLSANGNSYDLVYTADKHWCIQTRWRKDLYPSLEAALDYIEENLWYERIDSNGRATSYDEDEDY